MSLLEWSKLLPAKNFTVSPKNISAADLIADHSHVFVQDFQNIVDFDSRIEHCLNIELKYRNVLIQEE